MTANSGMGLATRREFLASGAGAIAGVVLADAGFGREPEGGPAGGSVAGLTLRQASEALRRKEASSVDLTQACLSRIEQHQKTLNAFITVTAERALAEARAMDAELARGTWRGPLHGIPIALKDNIDTAGVRTTAASALFADRVPAEDADVVRRLKAAGAVCLGKLNLHEFAAGGTSAITYYGPVRNPWKPQRAAGGSSGGSAAAVSADMCFGALGTDTGGSIRIPASFCGIVGLKATYGRVSNRGVIPLCWSFDHVGPMCKTVEDAALMLEAIAGYDPLDVSSRDVPVQPYAEAVTMKTAGLRLGIPRAMFYDNLDPGVEAAVGAALKLLGSLAASAREVVLPAMVTIPDSVWESEIYAYHSQYFPRSASSYQLSTRRFLQAIASTSAADYVLGHREVARLRRVIGEVFRDVDLLITPTTERPPYTVEESIQRDESEKPLPPMLGATWQFNVLGLPTISVPCGFTAEGLPVGLQISGPPFGETQVLALAHTYEQAAKWHRRRPPLKG